MLRVEISQLPKCSGIYMFKNTKNNKVYIGSTVNLNGRIKKHFYEIKKEVHHNSHLQRAVKKYGEKSFEIYLLKVFDKVSVEELRKAEEIFILEYNSYEKGYNMLENKSKHLTKLNQSESHIKSNKKRSSKPVMMFDKLTGKHLITFDSVSKTALYLGISSSNVSKACRREEKSFRQSYTFCYKDNFDSNKNYSYRKSKVVASEETKQKLRKSSKWSKKTYQYNLNWNLVNIYDSRSEAERQNSFRKEQLRNKIDKQTPFEGYYWTHNKVKDIV